MIRPMTPEDLYELPRIYAAARSIMKESGNPFQWGDDRPSMDLLRLDVKQGTGYVLEEDGRLYGAFALLFGEDPTYAVIDGAWKSDAPYATLHRVASDGSRHGVLHEILSFCRTRSPELRIDTHEDNRIMQKLLAREGFECCGIIHLVNGDPRLAFQWIASTHV